SHRLQVSQMLMPLHTLIELLAQSIHQLLTASVPTTTRREELCRTPSQGPQMLSIGLFSVQVFFLNLPDYEYGVCGTSSWPKSKLHVVQADQISHLPFYFSLKNLHHLIKQLYPSVRTTIKSVSFTFVHAYHPTLFPICWNTTLLHNCIE